MADTGDSPQLHQEWDWTLECLVVFFLLFLCLCIQQKYWFKNWQFWSRIISKTIFCTFQVMAVLSWPLVLLAVTRTGVASAWSIHPCTGAVYMLLPALCTWYHSNCRDLASPLPLLSRHFVKITVTFWFQFELIMSVIVNISLVWLRILHTITLTIVTA